MDGVLEKDYHIQDKFYWTLKEGSGRRIECNFLELRHNSLELRHSHFLDTYLP
jgi:hypothetical protein